MVYEVAVAVDIGLCKLGRGADADPLRGIDGRKASVFPVISRKGRPSMMFRSLVDVLSFNTVPLLFENCGNADAGG